jgi:xylulokinase
MDRILAVDVGTQSLKGCVFDGRLRLRERVQVSYTPRVKGRSRVEIDAHVLWEALLEACRSLKEIRDVQVVSFSTLCPSLLPMDGEGRPLGPVILHLDRRSYAQALWALRRVGEERFLQSAGNLPVPGGISLTSILWIREHHPEIYQRKDVVFGHAVTFFMKRLAGVFVIDPSNASFTGLYDTVGYGDWDPELLELLEIDGKKLPAVALSTTVAGSLGPEAARATGLRPGIPVVVGANDTTCAAVGAGVTEPGDLMNTSGTVEILVLCTDHPLISKEHLLRTHAYPGRWLAMRTVGAGGASLEWFRGVFCKDMTKEDFYQQYLPSVLGSSRRPQVRFHPYLSGDRHRVRQMTASFTRLTLGATREDFLLALVHGIVSFQTRALSRWQREIPLKPRICHVGGGASEAYTLYKQRKVRGYRFILMGETAPKGAAKLALQAAGAGPCS